MAKCQWSVAHSSSLDGFTRFHTPESQVIAAGGDLALAARADHVARAILVCAEKGTSTMDPFFLRWLGGVVRRFRALGVARHPALRGQCREVVGPIPIAAPLPNVSGHVVKPVTVRWELRDGSEAGE